MSANNKTNSTKKLIGLIGIASTGIFLSLPALALNNSSINSANSNSRGRDLLAQNTSGTGATGTNGTGINQPNNGGFGTNGTGINQPNNGATGAGQGTSGTTPGNQQSNIQQGSFEQLMRFGYAATQQRDYATALSYFQQANQLRPNNPYAMRAIRNVSGYIQRDAQGGANTAPTNQGMR